MIVDRQTHRYRQTDARHKFTILRFHVGGGVLNEKQRTSSAVLAIACVVTLYHLQGKVLSEPVNATNDCFPKYQDTYIWTCVDRYGAIHAHDWHECAECFRPIQCESKTFTPDVFGQYFPQRLRIFKIKFYTCIAYSCLCKIMFNYL